MATNDPTPVVHIQHTSFSLRLCWTSNEHIANLRGHQFLRLHFEIRMFTKQEI